MDFFLRAVRPGKTPTKNQRAQAARAAPRAPDVGPAEDAAILAAADEAARRPRVTIGF